TNLRPHRTGDRSIEGVPRTAVLALVLAVVLLAPAAPAAAAGEIHVLAKDGSVRVVHDPALPPPDPATPGPLGALHAPRAALQAPVDAPVARAAAKRTVKRE